jgi:beta-xylosidase
LYAGIPVLHSKDLVNWTIITMYTTTFLLKNITNCSWRRLLGTINKFHNNKFYVYFCTPYDGLFVATADHPSEKWTLKQIVKVENWEDPCPLWDDDGNAYLVRSKFCGNALYLHKMSSDGMEILDNGVEIFRDKHQPTIEGPKFMKDNGYYYIFAPAGGVANGWQTVLRSKNIYGPYVFKDVLHAGNTNINGPHQGGMVKLDSGEWWFLHFQDKDMYGRIAHLQPMNWNVRMAFDWCRF